MLFYVRTLAGSAAYLQAKCRTKQVGAAPCACLPLSGLQFLPFSAARAVCISPQYFHPLAFPFTVPLPKTDLFVSLCLDLYNLSAWPCVLHSPLRSDCSYVCQSLTRRYMSVYADRSHLLPSGSSMSETDKKSRCQFPVLASSHVGTELSSSFFRQMQIRVSHHGAGIAAPPLLHLVSKKIKAPQRLILSALPGLSANSFCPITPLSYKNGSRRLCEESRKKGGGRVLSPPASI